MVESMGHGSPPVPKQNKSFDEMMRQISADTSAGNPPIDLDEPAVQAILGSGAAEAVLRNEEEVTLETDEPDEAVLGTDINTPPPIPTTPPAEPPQTPKAPGSTPDTAKAPTVDAQNPVEKITKKQIREEMEQMRAQIAELKKSLDEKGAKHRDEAMTNVLQARHDAALDMLCITDEHARKTLYATFDAFPPSTDPAIDAENKKVREVIAQRRFAIFQEGQRKTEKVDIEKIGKAILEYQKAPWHVRWGLSGMMASGNVRDSVVKGIGVSAIPAVAFFGACSVATVTPFLLAAGAGMGARQWVLNIAKKRNATGRGKGFVAKHPEASALLAGTLAGFTAGGLTHPPSREAFLNVLDKAAIAGGAALKGVLSYLSSTKAVGIKIAI